MEYPLPSIKKGNPRGVSQLAGAICLSKSLTFVSNLESLAEEFRQDD